jgi:hypothetical protein
MLNLSRPGEPAASRLKYFPLLGLAILLKNRPEFVTRAGNHRHLTRPESMRSKPGCNGFVSVQKLGVVFDLDNRFGVCTHSITSSRELRPPGRKGGRPGDRVFQAARDANLAA